MRTWGYYQRFKSGGGGEASIEKLHYPVCSQEESVAIAELMANCPVDFRQKALDEIEGARQAGVIKTNIVPFARGVLLAIARGTFTIGHGSKIAHQRMRQGSKPSQPQIADIPLDPEAIRIGKAFITRVGRR